MALASSTGPPASKARSSRLTALRVRPVAATSAAAAAASISTPLNAGRNRPGIRPRSPAIGTSAIAPATPAVSGPAGTATRMRTAAAATRRAWPWRRSGSSVGLVSQAAPSAPISHGTTLSRMGFSPTGNRVARKSATSTATVRVTARRVSPSKLDRTRSPARGNNRVAAIGPMAHAAVDGSTSSTSDQPLAANMAIVATWRRTPALPYAISSPAAKRTNGK